MKDESLEQYNRGLVRIYIENASLETLIELQELIAHWIKYQQQQKRNSKNEKQRS